MFVGLIGREVGVDMGGKSLCWGIGEGPRFMARSSGFSSVVMLASVIVCRLFVLCLCVF